MCFFRDTLGPRQHAAPCLLSPVFSLLHVLGPETFVLPARGVGPDSWSPKYRPRPFFSDATVAPAPRCSMAQGPKFRFASTSSGDLILGLPEYWGKSIFSRSHVCLWHCTAPCLMAPNFSLSACRTRARFSVPQIPGQGHFFRDTTGALARVLLHALGPEISFCQQAGCRPDSWCPNILGQSRFFGAPRGPLLAYCFMPWCPIFRSSSTRGAGPQ